MYILTDVDVNQSSPCFSPNVDSFPSGCPTLTIQNGIASISNDQFDLLVYPNPFDESITINAYLGEETGIKVTIYDIIGQITNVNDFGIKHGTFQESISVPNHTPGLYLVKILINNKAIIYKLIKK